ncbi:NADP-dependent 3-hydroxy acid dehydrogenase YdfG [bioreactor metagenome]|uniref:NADP-dependent 3-hydroxy acid dehydrogenase YdfG n=1 Tax=bioreactor metagenome TaxID=1076179 RepID=A0A645DVD5_9ZZZZ
MHAELGPIDALVNNAGASCPVMNPLYLPEDQLMSVLEVNLIAVFRLARLVLPDMIERGGGTILTVSSLAAVTPNLLGGAAYGAAKAGVRNFMTFLHNTFRGDGVRAITVLPGETNTPILEKRPAPPAAETRAAMTQPEDIAEAIVMALSLPARACAQEIIVCPTRQRDPSADLAFARSIGAPNSQK